MSRSKPIVAMVTDAIAPFHNGGKEQRYRELAPRLLAYADVHVYSMHWWDGPRTMVQDGVTYHAICPFVPLYAGGRRSIPQALLFSLACLRLCFARFDVLEADHMPYIHLLALKLVTLVRRKRFVVTWHEVWGPHQWADYLGPAGRIAWWLERWSMSLPDCIVAASPQTAERLRQQTNGSAQVVTAANGVDLALIARVPAAADSVDVISVGRLLGHKRFDLLIDCVALLADGGNPRRCRIVGDGPDREALHLQAERLGVGHLVDFRHDVDSPAELLSLVKSSRLFLFPSEREGFGIAALEAIACGVPVITTSAPDNLARELVGRSARGVICDPTAAALATAVACSAAQDDDPLETGGDDWLAEYDWTTVAECVADALMVRGSTQFEPSAPASSPWDDQLPAVSATPATSAR
jgi:glycosyltransferase involved in cell wall biosynthesis